MRPQWFIIALGLSLGCGTRSSAGRAKPGPGKVKIASTVVVADELLLELGDDVVARTVGVSAMVDDARHSAAAGRWPAEVTRLGRNPEELLALRPDVVFMASFSAPEYRAAVERSLDVVVLEDFTGFAGFVANTRLIGKTVGAEDQAEAVVKRFEARRTALEAKRPDRERWPTCMTTSGGYVAGKDTTFHDAVTTAGCVNLPAREGIDGHARVDTEQIVAWNPDYLVVECVPEGCDATVAAYGALPGLGGLPAVTEGRLVAVPSDQISSVGEGMLDLAATVQAALSR